MSQDGGNTGQFGTEKVFENGFPFGGRKFDGVLVSTNGDVSFIDQTIPHLRNVRDHGFHQSQAVLGDDLV